MISSLQCYSTIDDVRRCPVKTPRKVGHLWAGIPHGKLIDALQNEFRRHGSTPYDCRYDLSRDGADLAASWQSSDYPGWTRGIEAGFGLVTSNARRRALTFYVGGVETSTGTPIVVEAFQGWKYITGIDLASEASDAVDLWYDKVILIGHVIGLLKSEPITKRDVALLLMTAGRKKAIPWSRIGRIDWTWQHNGDATSWGLMKAFWTCASVSPAQDQMGQLRIFSNIVMSGVRALTKEAV
jgi:hypothetical protein